MQFETEILSSEPEAQNSPRNVPSEAVSWLTEKKLLSVLQSEILLAGHSGPFVYGNYVLEQKLDNPLLPHSYLGVHRGSSFPVMLQFLPGNSKSDINVWNEVEALAERAKKVHSDSVLPVIEPIALPQHRFVVTARPPGQTLAERLPRKTRLPWRDACVIFSQIARGLHELHETGIVHNAISPRVIWFHKSGLSQLQVAIFNDASFETPDISQKHSESRLDYMAPEAYVETTVDSPKLSRQSDLYSLGCTLFRAIAGKVLFEEPDIPKKRFMHQKNLVTDFSKYDFPSEFEKLLSRLLAKKPDARPTNALVVADQLQRLAGEKFKLKSVPGITPAATPGLAKIRKAVGFFDPQQQPSVASVRLDVDEPTSQPSSSAPERIEAAKKSVANRKQNNWTLPIALLGSLFVIAAIIGLAVMLGSEPVKTANSKSGKDEIEKSVDAEVKNTKTPANTSPLRFVQDLISDDRATLWQSPTDRVNLPLAYFPPDPKLLFTLRAQAFLETTEGSKILSAMGPEFSKLLQEWQNRVGLTLQDIQRITVSLHPNEQLQYDFFFQIELPQQTNKSNLLQIWKQPAEQLTESGESIFVRENGNAFYFLPTQDKTKCKAFVLGKKQRVQEVVRARGFTGWSGTLQRLSGWIDADQHFTFLFLRPALFNDEGQWLMGEQLSNFNRQLALLMDDQIRGGLLSLHLDDGTYTEFTLDRNSDIKASELKSRVDSQFRTARDQIAKYFNSAPPADYWDPVRIKAPLMFANIYQNLRVSVEYGEVTGNCWLPPMAAHNLIAVAELATSFTAGTPTSSPTQSTPRKIPASLTELLKLPRDLTVNTNPDMNILLSNIRQEVIDDYGGLPFEFNIRLLGNDLSKEGITQNQRPSDFEMKQTSLEDILTQIMVRCNPKKDISGPSDPDCKLVWVLAEDPNSPGNQAVLITTRAAVEARGDQLPAAFQTKNN